MKTRILCLASLFVTGFTLQNCCSDVEELFFDIVDMDIVQTVSFDNTGVFDLYIASLRFDVEYIAAQDDSWNFSLMNQAYGLEPCISPGENGSKEEAFEDIVIITLNDFNDNYSANDTITSLFTTDYFDASLGSEWIPIPEYLERNDQNILRETFSVNLSKAPTLDSLFQIKIRVDLTTGESYEVISDEISFVQ